MMVERRLIGTQVELWEYEWDNTTKPAFKRYIRSLGVEQPLISANHSTHTAICWAEGRTLGNIAVFNQQVLGSFQQAEGANAILPCDFVDAGRYRNGADRWWCRTHQTHWGINADLAAAKRAGRMVCSNHAQPMSYVVNPVTIDIQSNYDIGVWCSLPAAISSAGVIPNRQPKIHVHVRKKNDTYKSIDKDFLAIALKYDDAHDMFGHANINIVNITPPAAFEFLKSKILNRAMDCINCSHCKHPHLDLGSFAATPHKKHFCGNCGRDSTWSRYPIISTPLKPMHDAYGSPNNFVLSSKTLNLDEYQGCNFVAWASTPAIIWTADRPQEVGIHIHLADHYQRFIDDTFGEVIYQGQPLNRNSLLELMIAKTII